MTEDTPEKDNLYRRHFALMCNLKNISVLLSLFWLFHFFFKWDFPPLPLLYLRTVSESCQSSLVTSRAREVDLPQGDLQCRITTNARGSKGLVRVLGCDSCLLQLEERSCRKYRRIFQWATEIREGVLPSQVLLKEKPSEENKGTLKVG